MNLYLGFSLVIVILGLAIVVLDLINHKQSDKS